MRRRAAAVALLAGVAGAASTGPASAAAAPGERPVADAVAARTSSSSDRSRRSRGPARRVRRVPRKRRGGHVPAWVLRPGALPGSLAVPGLAPPGAGLGTPATVTPPATTPPPGGGTTPPPGPGTGTGPTCGVAVGARESEWEIRLSRSRLCAGTVTVEAQNWGQDAHDLWISPQGGAPLWKFGEAAPHLAPGNPGGIESKQLTLTPGTYELFCSLVGGTPPGTPGGSHAAAGMTATLTVVAP